MGEVGGLLGGRSREAKVGGKLGGFRTPFDPEIYFVPTYIQSIVRLPSLVNP